VVFGVLAQVAQSGGVLDFQGKLVSQLVFQLLDFFQQFLLDVFGHENNPLRLMDMNRFQARPIRLTVKLPLYGTARPALRAFGAKNLMARVAGGGNP
jgi:hypothetical protein